VLGDVVDLAAQSATQARSELGTAVEGSNSSASAI